MERNIPSQTALWYCCNCSHGPWNSKIDTHCHNCGARRCSRCRVRARREHVIPEKPVIQQEREAPQPGQTEHVRLDHQQQVSAKPVVQDVLAIHSDSGYASNDIARTQSGVQTHMGKVAIDAPGELPVASFADAKTYGSLPQQEPDYEVGSVLSDEDDNRSMGVSPKSRPVLEAQSQIRALFALNENLQLLAKDLLAKMGRERFVENFRRLLMSYYKLQKQLARSNLEHAVVVLLGSRTLREGIATQVADTLVPTSDQMRLDHEKDMERIRDTTASVEDWLSKNLAFAQHAEPLEQNDGENANLQHEDSSDSDDEHQADKSQVEFAHITRAAQFLCASNAVENLLLDMQVLSIPSELHILAQTLLTIPRDDVRIYCEYKPTFWNKCKIFVDEATNVDWNWWPLDPAIPPLPADRVRIWWKCVHAHLFEKLLSLRTSVIRSNHLCQTAFKRCGTAPRTHLTSSDGSNTAAGPLASLSAGDTGRGQADSAVPRPASDSTASSSVSRSASGSSSTDATSLGSGAGATSNQEHFVLLGISGTRGTLELEHIQVLKGTTEMMDAPFFKEVKARYRLKRGFWRIWFSVWRLNHCEFVKFKKFRAGRVVNAGRDLPTDAEYTYNTRPPKITVLAPDITKHMWQHALSPCEERTMGLILGYCPFGLFHDCIEPLNPVSREYVNRIPKRHSRWLIRIERWEDAFGILAKEQASMLYMVVYHVLFLAVVLAGPFAFWAWALPRDSKKEGFLDLQNPSMPAMFALGLLSFICPVYLVLWSNKGEKHDRA